MRAEVVRWVCICSKCGHRWETRVDGVPTKCPRCKRVTWDDDSPPDMELDFIEADVEFEEQRYVMEDDHA